MKKLFLALISLFSFEAFADKPHPWQHGFQDPASPVMHSMVSFHDKYLLPMNFIIGGFVLLLLVYVCVRYSKKNNPVPDKFEHNTTLEIIWTLIPTLIVLYLGYHSLPLMKQAEFSEKPDLTVKIVGHQWYWSYEYPDQNINFDSNMIQDQDLKPSEMRLYEVDNKMVVPVNKVVKVLVTGADVIHSWGVPALGVKRDAIPGRTNETWFLVEKPGVYYGHCYEICGVNHGFMPIAVEAVSEEDFNAWVAKNNPAKVSMN